MKILLNKNIILNHRQDIDRLRAIAVLAVIINHFDYRILPGGFLGVDIFFVISGFVITASLYKRRYNIQVETPLWWEHDIDEENKEWEQKKESDDNKSDKDETDSDW